MSRTPLDQFSSVFVGEFLRELQAYLDAYAGRTTLKADFTDKLTALVQNHVVGLIGDLPFPGVTWAQSAVSAVIDWGNGKRKESKQYRGALEAFKVDLEQLRILLEMVAMETARRYQFWITHRLSDDPLEGVVLFAKSGVERALGYILCKEVALQEDYLLYGLMTGHSGKFVSDYRNTALAVREEARHRLKDKIKSVVGLGQHTSEGAYKKPGIRTSTGDLFALTDKTKLPPEKSATNLDYGYTHVLDGTQTPKYGYVDLPLMLKQHFWGDLPKQSPDKLSKEFQETLANYQPTWLTINRAELEAYVKTTAPRVSLLDYARTLKKSPKAIRVFFIADSADDNDLRALNFEGVDLSNSVFNHCQFGRSLKNTKWQNSYLREVDFSKVSSAQDADFGNAHLEFLKAPSVNFSSSNFVQARLHYADLSNANLTGCGVLGAIWHQATLKDIKTDSLSEITEKQQQYEDTLKEQVTALQTMQQSQQEQQKQLQGLQQSFAQLQVQKGDAAFEGNPNMGVL